MTAEGCHVDLGEESMRIGELFLFEIGGEGIRMMLSCTLEQVFDLLFAQPNGQHAVFETVVVENVGEAGGDDHAEAIVVERPGSMLTAGAATEVAPGQQDCGSLSFGLIELEIR